MTRGTLGRLMKKTGIAALMFLVSCTSGGTDRAGDDSGTPKTDESSAGSTGEDEPLDDGSTGGAGEGDTTTGTASSDGTTTTGSDDTTTSGGTTTTSTGADGSTTGDPTTSSDGSDEGDTTPPPGGGASAAAVCPRGVTFGDPFEGMGEVVTIGAPQGDFFAFVEGPVWIGELGTLFFSDNASFPEERIWKIVPPSTTPEVFMPESGSNGLAIDVEDRLVLADQRRDRIVRVDPVSGEVLDELVPPGAYNPNDLILRSDGNLYFTDPDSGFYRVAPNGDLTGPMRQVNRPNGVVLSADENTLYVGDDGNRQVHRFSVASDGSVDAEGGSIFVTTNGGTVDGMAVDCADNLYVGTADGVEVYAPDASLLGTIDMEVASNCTFGGEDRRTLYVTSRSVIKAVQLGVPGLPN